MKELRFEAMNDEWRVAFAFDPKRVAVMLVGGGKVGNSEKRFYKALIKKADERLQAAPCEIENRGERGKEMTTLQEKLKQLPAVRRKKIDRRTAQLIGEELTMRELRKARNITQARLAQVLHIKQEQVSRIEKRTDLHISTLRRQIEALGGSLTILATFPNGAPVKIAGLGELEA
jgi:DNA-binding XRE family transcriptional regulator